MTGRGIVWANRRYVIWPGNLLGHYVLDRDEKIIGWRLRRSDAERLAAERFPEHTLTVESDGWGNLSVSAACPYELDDRARPCWPYELDGTPEPEHGGVCTYVDWIDAVGSECLGPFEVSLPIVDASWEADSPTFRFSNEGQDRA